MMEGLSRRITAAGDRRTEALEAEVRALKATLAASVEQAARDGEATRQVAIAIADIGNRLAGLERRADIGGRVLQKASAALQGLKTRGKADEQAFVELRTAMLRLELELGRHADEVHTTAAALLERIEAVRARIAPLPA